MATYLVLTATGRDKPGVVDSVAEKIAAQEGNVEISRMARIGGEFTMLALISMPESNVLGLLSSLRELEDRGLFVRLRQTDPHSFELFENHIPLEVNVTGADHPGIIHHVSHFLATRQINIETMDTHITAAPMSGQTLFMMHAQVFAPSKISKKDLQLALDRLGNELAVDIEVTEPRET